ncbi:hypothetical protein [Arvimicrobium flavum]|uniref:hypothetical protein n=1 Tax=Arvimicrobium flavum TaxID=3393320 RepID=UPI00237A77AF|nr:hypothetical protein [Mesorhizobium shangrilense]
MSRTARADVVMGATVFTLLSLQPANAYVDPGSVSVVVTAVLGAIATIGYGARLYWAKIGAFFRRQPAAKTDDNDRSR